MSSCHIMHIFLLLSLMKVFYEWSMIGHNNVQKIQYLQIGIKFLKLENFSDVVIIFLKNDYTN